MLPRTREFLTTDEIRALRTRSNAIGALLVLHAWALIAGAMALFAWQPNPLTFVLAVMVIGARQLGLAILMHDAAHGLLFANRGLNDRVGQWLCAWPVVTDLHRYRPYHLAHHRNTQQPNDPDLGLSAPFPITRASLRRKAVRDLTGRTALLRRREQFVRSMSAPGLPLAVRLANLWRAERGPLLANAALLALCAAAGHWYLFPLLWLLPLATWYQFVSRIRNIAEHAVVPDNDDPLRNTRTTIASALERLFVAPYRVNYHLEHHLFLFVPCWRLPEAHRLMLEKGLGSRMELRRGYAEVLRLATARHAEPPGGPGGRRGPQYI